MSQRHSLMVLMARVSVVVVFFSTLLAIRPVAAAHEVSGLTAGPGAAKVTFRRIFQGSSPEFIEVTVQSDSNAATYEIRQLDEDPGAQPFEVGEALRSKIFTLTQQLNEFQGQDLDVHRKIANLGEKTFRWQQGSMLARDEVQLHTEFRGDAVNANFRGSGPSAGALCAAGAAHSL